MRVSKINICIRYFLLILFLHYTAGISLFTHYHVVNGISIAHSHPYNKAVKHTHTAVEFELIQMLNHFVSTDYSLPVFVLTFLAAFTIIRSSKRVTGIFSKPYYGLVGLRAPPVAA